MPLIEVGLIVD